ncbi:ferritin-like domain-containing protein [Actinokineospora sp. NPDC004072]
MSQPGMPQESVAAVQAALGAEHAALWVYGLVSAFLPAAYDKALADGVADHRDRRDAVAELLVAAGVTPAAAEPAYVPPEPVKDEKSAAKLVATAETDATVAWRAVLERTDDRALREIALAALTGSSVRATRWRKAAGTTPVVTPFPGQP